MTLSYVISEKLSGLKESRFPTAVTAVFDTFNTLLSIPLIFGTHVGTDEMTWMAGLIAFAQESGTEAQQIPLDPRFIAQFVYPLLMASFFILLPVYLHRYSAIYLVLLLVSTTDLYTLLLQRIIMQSSIQVSALQIAGIGLALFGLVGRGGNEEQRVECDESNSTTVTI